MTALSALVHGRELIERQAWESAYALLSAEDRERALEPDDLARLATAYAYEHGVLGRST